MLGMFVVGCSNKELAAGGLVQFSNGQSVQSGSVEFRSLANGERYASRIGEIGQFELMDSKGRVGIPPGEYEVVVVQIVLTEDLALDKHTHGGTVPRRYADYYTSGLTKKVGTSPDETIRLVIEPE
jgi:hypothetical protein